MHGWLSCLFVIGMHAWYSVVDPYLSLPHDLHASIDNVTTNTMPKLSVSMHCQSLAMLAVAVPVQVIFQPWQKTQLMHVAWRNQRLAYV